MHPFLKKMVMSDRLPTACLLVGPESVDLEQEAKELLQHLFCKTSNACGDCVPCRKVVGNSHPDGHRIEPEKGAIKIGEIRELLRQIQFKPLEGGMKVALLVSAERMTEGAANALLKTLEEPPPLTLFLLTTSIPERLPATIRSRCRKISFLPKEEFKAEEFKELLVPWRERFFPILAKQGRSPFATVSQLAEELLAGEDPARWLALMKIWWRDLIVYRDTGNANLLLLAKPEEIHGYLDLHGETLNREFQVVGETERALEGNVLKQLAFERLFFNLVTASQ